jgi:hypothetical protein
MAIEAGEDARNMLLFWAVAFAVGAILCYLGARWAMDKERSAWDWAGGTLLLPFLGGIAGLVAAFFSIGLFVGGARLGFLSFPAVFFTIPFSLLATPLVLGARRRIS